MTFGLKTLMMYFSVLRGDLKCQEFRGPEYWGPLEIVYLAYDSAPLYCYIPRSENI